MTTTVGSSSFLVWSVVLGFLLGSLTVTGLETVLSATAMDVYGWRIPFLIAGMLGVVGLYFTETLEFSKVDAFVSITFASIVALVLIPPLGALSDRIGRKPLLITGAIGFAVFA